MGRIHTKGIPAGRDPSDFPAVPFTSEEETARDAEEEAWSAAAPVRMALGKIRKLEAEVTPRRLRDSVLTTDGKTWLTNKEAEIATERDKL